MVNVDVDAEKKEEVFGSFCMHYAEKKCSLTNTVIFCNLSGLVTSGHDTNSAGT